MGWKGKAVETEMKKYFFQAKETEEVDEEKYFKS